MPAFAEHILQVRHNLEFLEKTNQHHEEFWDWQVTVCFYCAVHLINAHLAKTCNLHYRKHTEVFNAINPYRLSPGKIGENEYVAFQSLYNLSRRSRYLVNEKMKNRSTAPHFTYEKHFEKAVRHLDVILGMLKARHNASIQSISIHTPGLSQTEVNHFDIR